MAKVMAASPSVAEYTTTMVSSSPRLDGRLVPDAAPQVDDLLTQAINAARSSQLSATGKVLEERVPHGLEALADVSLNFQCVRWPTERSFCAHRDGQARGGHPMSHTAARATMVSVAEQVWCRVVRHHPVIDGPRVAKRWARRTKVAVRICMPALMVT